jgi:hypothetical protein
MSIQSSAAAPGTDSRDIYNMTARIACYRHLLSALQLSPLCRVALAVSDLFMPGCLTDRSGCRSWYDTTEKICQDSKLLRRARRSSVQGPKQARKCGRHDLSKPARQPCSCPVSASRTGGMALDPSIPRHEEMKPGKYQRHRVVTSSHQPRQGHDRRADRPRRATLIPCYPGPCHRYDSPTFGEDQPGIFLM